MDASYVAHRRAVRRAGASVRRAPRDGSVRTASSERAVRDTEPRGAP
jgi:hypothetical protein